jgi:hypothetical protein
MVSPRSTIVNLTYCYRISDLTGEVKFPVSDAAARCGNRFEAGMLINALEVAARTIKLGAKEITRIGPVLLLSMYGESEEILVLPQVKNPF